MKLKALRVGKTSGAFIGREVSNLVFTKYNRLEKEKVTDLFTKVYKDAKDNGCSLILTFIHNRYRQQKKEGADLYRHTLACYELKIKEIQNHLNNCVKIFNIQFKE